MPLFQVVSSGSPGRIIRPIDLLLAELFRSPAAHRRRSPWPAAHLLERHTSRPPSSSSCGTRGSSLPRRAPQARKGTSSRLASLDVGSRSIRSSSSWLTGTSLLDMLGDDGRCSASAPSRPRAPACRRAASSSEHVMASSVDRPEVRGRLALWRIALAQSHGHHRLALGQWSRAPGGTARGRSSPRWWRGHRDLRTVRLSSTSESSSSASMLSASP